MANLKEIRNRISSVSSTMQITSAMKMVSAAKLKRAQDAITAMRPYAEKLTELIQNLSGSLTGDAAGKYAEQREVNKVLIVAIASNRGLCGAFNANVLKQVKAISSRYNQDNVGIFAGINAGVNTLAVDDCALLIGDGHKLFKYLFSYHNIT